MLDRRTIPPLLLLIPALSQAQPDWRYWNATDGVVESYTRALGRFPGGPVAIGHGVTGTADLLDGYSVQAIPEPRSGTEVDYSRLAPVYALSPGVAWTVENNALKQYRDGKWVVRANAAPGEDMIGALPLDGRRVLVLFADRLAEFDSPAAATTHQP